MAVGSIPNVKLQIGKIRSTGDKYPWEPGYVEAIKAQCEDLKKIFTSICQQFVAVTPELLKESLRPTYEKSRVYCPKRTGDLVGSSYLEITDYRGSPRVEMGYARGGNPHYAVLVHENLNMWHRPPTQAKFLQRAVEEDIADIAIRIGTKYKKFMYG
jgi:hypothetical protein